MLRRRTRRHGLTLVELLIVISVAVLLMAAAVPLLRMPLQDRKSREGSRQLAAFIMRCKARAAELRRPVGVLIKRAHNGTQNDFVERAYYATQLYMVETPPPYSGDDTTSGARITVNLPGNDYQATIENSPLFTALVAAGDLIRFDFKGPLYRIVSVAPNGNFVDIVFRWTGHPNSLGPPITPVAPYPPVPFQVYRSPYVSLSGPASMVTNPPVELPNGVCVDLSVSGMGASGNQFYAATDQDATGVIVMFGPNGDVVRVYESVASAANPPTAVMADFDPTGTIFFLVGRLDQVVPADLFARGPDADPIGNIMDSNNIWVSIGHRTGKVTSAENTNIDALVPPPGQPVALAQIPILIQEARQIALGSQNIGGR